MLIYKLDVIEELKKVGINTNTIRKTKIFSQSTMTKFKNRDTNISLDNINRLCCLLEMQPRDLIKYVETEKDKDQIANKLKNQQRIA